MHFPIESPLIAHRVLRRCVSWQTLSFWTNQARAPADAVRSKASHRLLAWHVLCWGSKWIKLLPQWRIDRLTCSLVWYTHIFWLNLTVKTAEPKLLWSWWEIQHLANRWGMGEEDSGPLRQQLQIFVLIIKIMCKQHFTFVQGHVLVQNVAEPSGTDPRGQPANHPKSEILHYDYNVQCQGASVQILGCWNYTCCLTASGVTTYHAGPVRTNSNVTYTIDNKCPGK